MQHPELIAPHLLWLTSPLRTFIPSPASQRPLLGPRAPTPSQAWSEFEG